jgi:hypothetical protein
MMTNRIFLGALGALSVTLAAGAASVASAQTVIIRDPALAPAPATVVAEPVASAPVETVETVRTVSTDVGPRREHRRVARSRTERIATTRTVRCERIVAQPVYDTLDEPLYDVVPGADRAPGYYGAPGPGVTVAPAYQYIYEPDRILVIDPVTGIAVQSIPR